MERNTQEEIKAHLMQTNEKFRDLMDQHHEYERLVEELEAKHCSYRRRKKWKNIV